MNLAPSSKAIFKIASPSSDSSNEKIAALRQLITANHNTHSYQGNKETISSNQPHPWCLGVSHIDAALPQNRLRYDSVHEIAGSDYVNTATASGYALALLKRLSTASSASVAPFLWCQSFAKKCEFGAIHGAGLGAFGLDAKQFLFVTPPRNQDVLWALEEGARSSSLSAVIGEVDKISFTQTRRLALAAAAGGTPVFLIRRHDDLTASAAQTRWRINTAVGSPDPFVPDIPGNPKWQIELMRCRGGRPGTWLVEWDYETHHFHLAKQFCNRLPKTAAKVNAYTKYTCA